MGCVGFCYFQRDEPFAGLWTGCLWQRYRTVPERYEFVECRCRPESRKGREDAGASDDGMVCRYAV